MANLDDLDRQELWAEFMRQHRVIMSESGNSNLTKQQLRNIFNDIDAWLNDNKSAANAAIRQPERGIATNSLKFQILGDVAIRRAIKAV